MEDEADTMLFENVDIADIKHVEGRPFSHRRSLMIVTIADPNITVVDIEKMMEMGLNVMRFKASHITKSEKVKLIKRVDKASVFLARKYGILEWPCATAVELKTSVVQTGIVEEEREIWIKEDTDILLTCEVSEFDKCNEKQIFVDNPYLTSDVKIGMEINISQAEIIMECKAILTPKTIQCKVIKGGYLQNMAYVCMRGAIRNRPYISKKDLHIIKFAVEYQVDMIIINYPRHVDTIRKIKRYLGSKLSRRPAIITGISTQEGITSIDDFIKEADGILMSREFLAYEVEADYFIRMGRIQSYIGGKCRQAGKPFYISGGVFKDSLLSGTMVIREMSDVTNAILNGASGFVLGETPNVDNLTLVMKQINDLCASVEPLCMGKTRFWQLVSQIKMPVNAAEATAMSCGVVANQTHARCIIVPTVTGRTAYLLNWLRPNCIVIAVSTKVKTIRLLKTYRSIVPLLYRGAPHRTWFKTVQARVDFAIQYAVEKRWILYGDYYVTIEKGTEGSSFCDAVRVWKVTTTQKNTIECPESYHDFDINTYAPASNVKKTKQKTVITETIVKKIEEIKTETIETNQEDDEHEKEKEDQDIDEQLDETKEETIDNIDKTEEETEDA